MTYPSRYDPHRQPVLIRSKFDESKVHRLPGGEHGGGQFTIVESVDPKNVDPSARVLHAMKDGKKIGELLWRTKVYPPDQPGYLWGVFVDKEHQHQGIGTALYHHAQQLDPKVHIDPTKPVTEAGAAWQAKQGVPSLRVPTKITG